MKEKNLPANAETGFAPDRNASERERGKGEGGREREDLEFRKCGIGFEGKMTDCSDLIIVILG